MPEKKSISAAQGVVLGLSAVVVALRDDAPQVFIVRGAEHALSAGLAPAAEEGDALPFGPFDPENHPTMEKGLRGWVESQTPLRLGYVEQLYTFGNKGRYTGAGDARVVSVGYLALTQGTEEQAHDARRVFWGSWYDYFPWEDWRAGPPDVVHDVIAPALARWVAGAEDAAARRHRRTRVDMCFGLGGGSPWDEERVLERYELLYEARLVPESLRDEGLSVPVDAVMAPGRLMLYDHRRILATAMGRLRGKLKYRPVVFELMPAAFTLLQLQRTVEAIAGHRLHKQNFRRMVEHAGLVEEVAGRKSVASGGRPAALFRFRKEVLAERPAPGVRLSPWGG